MVCNSPAKQVIDIETGEILSFIQIDPSVISQAILAEENGEQVRIPVDLLVCSTCKQRVLSADLDILLCQSYLNKRHKIEYTQENLSDIQDILRRLPGPTLTKYVPWELKCDCGGIVHWLRDSEKTESYFKCYGCGKTSTYYMGKFLKLSIKGS